MAFVSPTSAQTITEIGSGTISTLPGSASDFIFFNDSTYNNQASHNVTGYADLTDFKFSGGVYGVSPGNTALITAPGGSSPVATGAVQANTGEDGGAFYQMAIGITSTGSATYNYNDFDVYVMYSNTEGQYHDSGVLLETESDYLNLAYNGFPANTVTVNDNNTSSSSAYYVEYNVQGYAADFTAGDFLALGAETIPSQTGTEVAYVGGIAFAAAPEPSTYALMLGGLGLLMAGPRLRRLFAASR